MNEMQIFHYENNEIRTILKDGEPWWVLKDVCQILGISKHRDTASRLDEDERGSVKSTPLDEKGRNLIPTPGGGQDMTIINESGLSKVILRSEMKMKRASIR